MLEHSSLVHLVEEGATREFVFGFYRRQGVSNAGIEFFLMREGISFPTPFHYTDLNPSPTRKEFLQYLSVKGVDSDFISWE